MVPSMINKGKLAEIQSSTAAAECCKYSVEMSVEWQVLFFSAWQLNLRYLPTGWQNNLINKPLQTDIFD